MQQPPNPYLCHPQQPPNPYQRYPQPPPNQVIIYPQQNNQRTADEAMKTAAIILFDKASELFARERLGIQCKHRG